MNINRSSSLTRCYYKTNEPYAQKEAVVDSVAAVDRSKKYLSIGTKLELDVTKK